MNKEDILKEINALIDRLEDACGADINQMIERLKKLVGML